MAFGWSDTRKGVALFRGVSKIGQASSFEWGLLIERWNRKVEIRIFIFPFYRKTGKLCSLLRRIGTIITSQSVSFLVHPSSWWHCSLARLRGTPLYVVPFLWWSTRKWLPNWQRTQPKERSTEGLEPTTPARNRRSSSIWLEIAKGVVESIAGGLSIL